LPIELEHRPFWAIKAFNFDIKQASCNCSLRLNELDELCTQSYANAKIYKAKTRAFQDNMISKKSLETN